MVATVAGTLLGLLLVLPLLSSRTSGRALTFALAIGGVLLAGLCPHPEIQRQAAGVVLLLCGLAVVRACQRPSTLAFGIILVGAGTALAEGVGG